MNLAEKHFREEGDEVLALNKVRAKAWTDMRRGRLFKKAYNRLRSVQDAEDAVQDAFEKALRYGHTFNPQWEFGEWFNTILGNSIRGVMRTNMNQQIFVEEEEGEDDEPLTDNYMEEHEILAYYEEVKPIITRSFNNTERDILELVIRHNTNPTDASRIIGRTPQYAHKTIGKFRDLMR